MGKQSKTGKQFQKGYGPPVCRPLSKTADRATKKTAKLAACSIKMANETQVKHIRVGQVITQEGRDRPTQRQYGE